MARVAMFVTNPFTADARVRKEADSLAGAGFDVTVFAVRDAALPDTETLPSGVRIRRVARGFTGRGNALVRKFQNARDLKTMQREFRDAALADGPFDVVCAHDLDTLEAGVLTKRATSASLVYDAHELYSESLYLDKAGAFERWLSKTISGVWVRHERSLIGNADLVVTVNPFIADEVAKRYAVGLPLVIRNIPEREPDREPLPLPEMTGLRVIYQGGLISDRGLPELLEAVALAPDVSIVLMGPGELRERLAARADEPDLAGRAWVLDPVPHADVIAVARSADVGVIPFKPTSLNNFYASPNKLFDYMHSGLAIVASELPFIASILNECGCGVTVPPGDPKAMAAALQALATDPERLAQLRAASSAAGERYTWHQEVAPLIEAYRRLSS